MKPIKLLFKELKFELLKVIALNVLLESIIFFLIIYLISFLLNITILITFVLTIIFFIYRFRKEEKKITLKNLEEKNPHLKEMLRTAIDNMDSDTLMAHALFSDVLKKARTLSSSALIEPNIVLKRIFIAILLSVIIIGVSFFNIHLDKYYAPLNKAIDSSKSFFKKAFFMPINDTNSALAEDFYGDPKLAKLSEKEINLKLTPNLNQIDFTKEEELGDENDLIEDYPEKVDVKAAEAGSTGMETLDVIDRKTAAEYSQEVK